MNLIFRQNQKSHNFETVKVAGVSSDTPKENKSYEAILEENLDVV